MGRPRISYGERVTVGPGWHRLVTLDGEVTFAIEVIRGRPKQCEYGWGHDWHATVLDITGATVFRCKVSKHAGARSVLERAGLMGSALTDGRRLSRGAVVIASKDEPQHFAVLNPASGHCQLVTTSESLAHQEASILDWSKLADAAEAEG